MRLQLCLAKITFACTAILTTSLYLLTQSRTEAKPLPAEATLSPKQLLLLRATEIKIATPTYIPVGFKLEKVQVEANRNTRVGGTNYTIFYRRYDTGSNKDLCFAIEATNGGIGDLPEGIQSFPVNSPIFGKTTLEYGRYGQAESSTFLSSWLGEKRGPFYRFVGAGVIPGFLNCTNLTTQEATRVTESLRYIKR